MTELASQVERTAFWGEIGNVLKDSLKGKKILVMSSGNSDAMIGTEAGSYLSKMGAEVMVGGTNSTFTYGGSMGEHAYLKAFEDVDAAVFVVPEYLEGGMRQDNGMVNAMKELASKPLGFGEDEDALPGAVRSVSSLGQDKIIAINPRKGSPVMGFVARVKGKVHEFGSLDGGKGFATRLSEIV